MPIAIFVDFSKAADPMTAGLRYSLPQFFDLQMCPYNIENQYLIHQALRNSKRSIDTLAEHLKELIAWREQNCIDLPEFSNINLDYYLESQCCYTKKNGDPLSWHTINSRYMSAHRFLIWCRKRELNKEYDPDENSNLSNKAKGRYQLSKLPYRKTQEPTRFLLLQSAIDLIKELEIENSTNAKLGCRNALMARLMLQCGLRLTEVVTFPISDLPALNYNGHSTAARVVGKGTKARLILIPNRLLADLWSYVDTTRALLLENIKDAKNSKELFIDSKGRPVSGNWIGKVIRSSAKRINLTATPHTLRHTFGTYHYLTNKDIIALSKIMGHEDPATTEKFYVHLASLIMHSSNYEDFQKEIDKKCGPTQ